MENQNRAFTSERITPKNAELIQDLINCALACEACSAACLTEDDVTLMTRCIELNRDCADTCFQAARLLMRDSEISSQFIRVAAEICSLCAEECNKHEADHCKLCAEACSSCADACRNSHGKIEM